jgi:hypothetical protein
MRTLSAVMLLFALAEPGIAAEIALTPTQGSMCKNLVARNEEGAWRCPGAAGYFVQMSTEDSHFFISFALNELEKNKTQDDLTWLWSGSGIGSRIEWHLADGRPYAAIFEISRSVPETGSVVHELVVAKVTPSGSCRVGTVSVLLEKAVKTARDIADSAAAGFQCGQDKETVRLAHDGKQVELPKNIITPHEVLDHGGSLMDSTRSDDGRIEIRYREPRAGLSVQQGALLFQGSVGKSGKMMGTAYTFKPGCSPAPYAVEGEWNDGVLLLSGAAPKRARLSCAVVGYDASSQNANLAFERDILLSDAHD